MDFGRLNSIDHIDFKLPVEPQNNAVVLRTKTQGQVLKVYIGCPVWGEKEWIGLIYPRDAREKDYLKYYARQFNCIELNSTYYRTPTPQTIENWAKLVPDGFKFCPKLPQEISHTKRLHNCEAITDAFCSVVRHFGSKLGTAFLQLSPYFAPEQVSVLEHYLDHFPLDIAFAVELREEQWFANENQFRTVCKLLQERNISTVITDTAGRRDVLHMHLSNTTAFIRFTANNLHPTDFPRIDEWAKRVHQWQENGLEEVYFFIHSPSHALMPHLAKYAVERFNLELGTSIPPCKILQDQQPELFSLE